MVKNNTLEVKAGHMCVCLDDGMVCDKTVRDDSGTWFCCTRELGHEGPCVACSITEHNLTNVALVR